MYCLCCVFVVLFVSLFSFKMMLKKVFVFVCLSFICVCSLFKNVVLFVGVFCVIPVCCVLSGCLDCCWCCCAIRVAGFLFVVVGVGVVLYCARVCVYACFCSAVFFWCVCA